MIKIRYTAWDGTQRVRLSAARVFEKLSEYLAHTEDVQQALDRLRRQGMESEGVRVRGLDDFLGAVRREIRRGYRQFNLDHATDEVRQRLEEMLARERTSLGSGTELSGDVPAPARFVDRLPASLPEAIAALQDYDFTDASVRHEFAGLLGELENVRALERFRSRYGKLFRGPEALGYAEALELMRRMQRLQQLEQELLRGDIEHLRPEAVAEILGPGAALELELLSRLQLLLLGAGYLVRQGGRTRLSPRGVRRIGELALRDIYRGLLRDRPGGHPTDRSGAGEPRPEATRPYRYGDPTNFDLVGTLRRSLRRGVGVPLRLEPQDFRVFEAEYKTRTATVLLLDMSWSMSWEGRFAAAKKVAMALESLVRSRYPRDYFGIVGFFTRAVELKVRELPEASWNMGDPFTNLQDGLRLASELLRRHPSASRQIIVVTDGQPTAYFRGGRLHCEWPLSFGGISLRAAQEALKEVERLTRQRVTINTFMLDDSPMLRAFVEQMTRINKGRAFYTRPDCLGEYLLVDYVGRKRKKV